MSEETTVAKFLAKRLPDYGVTHIFELVGGMITVLLDAVHQNSSLRVVSMHHEQACGFAAEGFTRMAGRPAVAMATSGPGATNLITAIGSCYFDSTPVVFITGQVNRHEFGQGVLGRQGGFQETDIVSIARPITKSAVQVLDANDFPRLLDEAFRVAQMGRPGPVLLDIPMDVQQSVIRVSSPPAPNAGAGANVEAGLALNRISFVDGLVFSLQHSQKPLLLLGGGVRIAGAVEATRSLVASWPIPVVSSLMGLDVIPTDWTQRVGLIGSYGNRWANRAVAEADLLLVIGSRLDIRQTGSDVVGFRGNRQIYHVDIDPSEINQRVPGCRAMVDGAGDFLRVLTERLQDLPAPSKAWQAEIDSWREEWPDVTENVPVSGINPNVAIREVSSAWRDVGAIVTDVGQHQMWAAQSIEIHDAQRFLTSGGMGSMGFGLPAAIGASLASTSQPVCLIAGDGGFQLNIQELQTLARLRLPVRMLIMDNGSHGMVGQFQESYFEGRYYSTVWGYSAPDFEAVARAYGIRALHAETHDELRDALATCVAEPEEPVLIRIAIDPQLNVYPKMAFGRPFGSMEPEVRPTAMEGT